MLGYKMPYIDNMNDVLPHINGRNDFVVADKGTFTVINYVVEMEDTFPPVTNVASAIRRECRGLVFCNKTGKIIRRAFHKFFNVSQKEETQPDLIDLNVPHVVLEKLDGSMISPFRDYNGKIWWGTKMVAPDFHETVEKFVSTRPEYTVLFNHLDRAGYSPIFEYVAPTNRIVVEYKEENLILTGVRCKNYGVYIEHSIMVEDAKHFGVPVVKTHDSRGDIFHLMQHTAKLEGEEGYVVCFANDYKVKIKADQYVQIHKAREKILFDRHIVAMILDQTIDDVKSLLPSEDRLKVETFERAFVCASITIVGQILTRLFNANKVLMQDRKTFAVEEAPKLDQFTRAVIFKHWDDIEGVRDTVNNTIRKHLTSNVKWHELRDVWFPNVKLNG